MIDASDFSYLPTRGEGRHLHGQVYADADDWTAWRYLCWTTVSGEECEAWEPVPVEHPKAGRREKKK